MFKKKSSAILFLVFALFIATFNINAIFAESKNNQNYIEIRIVGDKKMGEILSWKKVKLEKDDTVIDVLKRATKENKIQMEFKGKSGAAYVEGINSLYEFDRGPKSGWMYKVNGKFPEKSSGSYKLKAKDKVEWLYTENLGKDLGSPIGKNK